MTSPLPPGEQVPHRTPAAGIELIRMSAVEVGLGSSAAAVLHLQHWLSKAAIQRALTLHRIEEKEKDQ